MTVAQAAVATRPRTRAAGNAILLAVSVGIALAALELMARMLLPAPLDWRYPQTRYVADADLIFALEPGQHTFSADKPVVVNARGYRGPEIPYARTPGAARVLFLGDSIAFGYGVNDAEVVSERTVAILRAQGMAIEAVNTAVPAYNTEQEVASLARDGVRYAPDWVVLAVCWNDIGDKSVVRVDSAGELTTEGARGPSALDAVAQSSTGYGVRNLLKRSRLLYGTLQGVRTLETTSSPPDPQTEFRTNVLGGRETPAVADGWQRFEKALQRLRAVADAHGFRVVVAPFPIPLALERAFRESMYPRRVNEAAARAGFPVIDLESAFRKAFHGHESLFIPYDADHPNAAGHDLAAREIARWIAAHPVSAPGAPAASGASSS